MQIAIVDDQQTDIDFLHKKIDNYITQNHLSCTIDTFTDANKFLSRHIAGTWQIIFLDIYLDTFDGMNIARLLRERGDICQLVFTTSSTEHAIESYDVKASFYLLKPVDDSHLCRALDICIEQYRQSAKSITVICDRLPTVIALDTIIYSDTYHNAVHIYTTFGLFKTYITFNRFTEMLKPDPRFLLCYKGCVINMDHVIRVEESAFILTNQLRVQMRKRGSSALKKTYTNYLFSKSS